MLAKLCRSACGFRYETPAAFSTFFQVRSSRVALIGHRRGSASCARAVRSAGPSSTRLVAFPASCRCQMARSSVVGCSNRHLTHRVGIPRRAATAAALAALHMNGASGACVLASHRHHLAWPQPTLGHDLDHHREVQVDLARTMRKVGKFVLRVLSAMWVRRWATSASYLGRRFRGVRSQVA